MPRSIKCLFVGYPKETKGYYVYNFTDNKVFVIRNGKFLEREFVSKITSGRDAHLEEIREPQDGTEPQMEIREDSKQVTEPPQVTQGP